MVDRLKLERRRQNVLRIVGGVEYDPLRLRGHVDGSDDKSGRAGEKRGAEVAAGQAGRVATRPGLRRETRRRGNVRGRAGDFWDSPQLETTGPIAGPFPAGAKRITLNTQARRSLVSAGKRSHPQHD